ncbi:hypothetical protein GCM10028806_41670 [Spirosoma terrae]|uniref:DUF5666 domain-containing protein n=1 Tax=Spirosoma terrae TaxID=1968276 RepID=A0A6L9L471_9BACT|nr:hypothetical protein [Spirosoma terrae]NDU94167.1 hypothetical protein [Spirosoma terrae]
MEINANYLALLFVAATLAITDVNAQAPAEPGAPVPPAILDGPNPPEPVGFNRLQPGPGRRPPGNPGAYGRPDRIGPNAGLTSLTTVSGKVGQWIGNDDAILDGFTLTGSGNESTVVKFPPHLGQQVQNAVKPGSTVTITGFSDVNPEGETLFRLTSLSAGKATIADAPPVVPATPPAAPALTTSTGKVTDFKIGRDGRVNGIVLDNQTVVKVPPHVAYQLTNLATKGSSITVQGYPRNLRDGQVQLDKKNILNATVLTINGQQYLVR